MNTHVALCQQAGAELHVVLELEGTAGLELGAECGERGGLVELLHAADTTELSLSVLGYRHARCSAIATAMAAVRG